jgi:hypothetical protein
MLNSPRQGAKLASTEVPDRLGWRQWDHLQSPEGTWTEVEPPAEEMQLASPVAISLKPSKPLIQLTQSDLFRTSTQPGPTCESCAEIAAVSET